ncbi:Hypothetical Protein FCC1311_048102 [Hondaea fermentalgiana]|uniref:Uncharacterized protein n=1 Tax=Hondaea fermentalgiana TaxID=2315210 RepID=A0A2R5GFR6_9STRA|nr:Hypothetical Protein FCC1311_048102 [Hondaea fermentalgiana]|eukprot:GBG28588.1 Hypothetical Protein FCC1311_048102 [Hondaea fermentalgiana]
MEGEPDLALQLDIPDLDASDDALEQSASRQSENGLSPASSRRRTTYKEKSSRKSVGPENSLTADAEMMALVRARANRANRLVGSPDELDKDFAWKVDVSSLELDRIDSIMTSAGVGHLSLATAMRAVEIAKPFTRPAAQWIKGSAQDPSEVDRILLEAEQIERESSGNHWSRAQAVVIEPAVKSPTEEAQPSPPRETRLDGFWAPGQPQHCTADVADDPRLPIAYDANLARDLFQGHGEHFADRLDALAQERGDDLLIERVVNEAADAFFELLAADVELEERCADCRKPTQMMRADWLRRAARILDAQEVHYVTACDAVSGSAADEFANRAMQLFRKHGQRCRELQASDESETIALCVVVQVAVDSDADQVSSEELHVLVAQRRQLLDQEQQWTSLQHEEAQWLAEMYHQLLDEERGLNTNSDVDKSSQASVEMHDTSTDPLLSEEELIAAACKQRASQLPTDIVGTEVTRQSLSRRASILESSDILGTIMLEMERETVSPWLALDCPGDNNERASPLNPFSECDAALAWNIEKDHALVRSIAEKKSTRFRDMFREVSELCVPIFAVDPALQEDEEVFLGVLRLERALEQTRLRGKAEGKYFERSNELHARMKEPFGHMDEIVGDECAPMIANALSQYLRDAGDQEKRAATMREWEGEVENLARSCTALALDEHQEEQDFSVWSMDDVLVRTGRGDLEILHWVNSVSPLIAETLRHLAKVEHARGRQEDHRIEMDEIRHDMAETGLRCFQEYLTSAGMHDRAALLASSDQSNNPSIPHGILVCGDLGTFCAKHDLPSQAEHPEEVMASPSQPVHADILTEGDDQGLALLDTSDLAKDLREKMWDFMQRANQDPRHAILRATSSQVSSLVLAHIAETIQPACAGLIEQTHLLLDTDNIVVYLMPEEHDVNQGLKPVYTAASGKTRWEVAENSAQPEFDTTRGN